MALVEAGQAAPLRDLARAVDMPTSLAHRYLASLMASGLAVQTTSPAYTTLALVQSASGLGLLRALTRCALPAKPCRSWSPKQG
jgi:DNA-binding IclR family transcriptional regulator